MYNLYSTSNKAKALLNLNVHTENEDALQQFLLKASTITDFFCVFL